MNLATIYHDFDIGSRFNLTGFEAVLSSAARMQTLVDGIEANITAFEQLPLVVEQTLSNHAALHGTLNAYAAPSNRALTGIRDEPRVIVENSEYIAGCPADEDELNRRWQDVWGKSGPHLCSRYR